MAMSDDLQAKAAEMMKKILTVGVGAFFLTEEGLRTLISDFKLPKELLSGILDSANRTKNDFLKNMSKEILAQIMDRVDAKQLAQELLERNEIELEVKVNFKRK
jgi:hypothetical protein